MGIELLLEAFTAPAPSSAAASPTAIAAAPTVSSAWSSSKHPRASGGKFGYTTGGKRATRSASTSQRTVGVGSKGALVSAVQRQLGIKADGNYGPGTKAAIERYQRQHGLKVDGVIGRQTLASLRGDPNAARAITPGAITAKQARIGSHPLAKPAKVDRYGSGQIV